MLNAVVEKYNMMSSPLSPVLYLFLFPLSVLLPSWHKS